MNDDERILRRKMAEELGVEFFDPEDPEINLDVAKSARITGTIKKISVSGLIEQCNEAILRLSDEDPNKVLIWNCAFALRQLVDVLDELQNPPTVQ